MNKKQIVFILVICLMSLGLWQFLRRDISSTEMLGPSSFDFANSNYPQKKSQSEEENVTSSESLPANQLQTGNKLKAFQDLTSGLSTEDLQRFKIVEDILKSKNDNDSRIDTALKTLTPSLKLALQQRYSQLPEENRNQRGLIVFLVTREIHSEQDLNFIKTVYEEPPCMSLSDCRSSSGFDPHMDSVNQVTLDYPQKVGLYQLEKTLAEKPQMLSDAIFKKATIDLLQSAEKFPVPSIQRQAQKIRLKYHL